MSHAQHSDSESESDSPQSIQSSTCCCSTENASSSRGSGLELESPSSRSSVDVVIVQNNLNILSSASDKILRHTTIAKLASLADSTTGSATSLKLKPTTPSLTIRYDRRIEIEQLDKEWKIDPYSNLTPYIEHLSVPGWTSSLNPDGHPYHFKICPDYPTKPIVHYITEANLHNSKTLEAIEGLVTDLQSKVENQIILANKRLYIVLEKWDESWSYYIIDQNERSIFWLETYDVTWIADQIYGIPSFAHMKQWFMYEYWTFREHFPDVEKISEESVDELIGILSYGSTDWITAVGSTACYNSDDCRNLLGIIERLRNIRISSSTLSSVCEPYFTWSVSRIMSMHAQSRFMNMYGHYGVRLDPEHSIRSHTDKQPTIIFWIVSRLLFFSPDIYLRSLEKIWVDKSINENFWKDFTSGLKEDWEQLILNATVIMTANIALLAVPNLVINNGDQLSLSQIPSLLSAITSLGTILIGLLLARKHQAKSKETAADIAKWVQKRTHHILGLEILAIMYSLPYALLMWSVIYFVASIVILCFQSTNYWLRLIFFFAWFILAFLMFWTIYTCWTKADPATYKWFESFIQQFCEKYTSKLFRIRSPRKAQSDLEKQTSSAGTLQLPLRPYTLLSQTSP